MDRWDGWDWIGLDWTLFDIRAGICWKMLYLITGVVYKVLVVSGVFVMSRDGFVEIWKLSGTNLGR